MPILTYLTVLGAPTSGDHIQNFIEIFVTSKPESLILCLAVLVQYRLVTDRWIDRHTVTAYTRLQNILHSGCLQLSCSNDCITATWLSQTTHALNLPHWSPDFCPNNKTCTNVFRNLNTWNTRFFTERSYLLGNVNKRCLGRSGRKHTITYTYKYAIHITVMQNFTIHNKQ